MLRLFGMAVTTAALGAAALFAAPASAATITAKVNAKVVKPLVLTRVQDLDLGTVLLSPGSWTGANLRLSRAGVLTCPAQLTCSGATRVAIYNVSGSKQVTVRVSAPNVTLVNQSDPTKTDPGPRRPGHDRAAQLGRQGRRFPDRRHDPAEFDNRRRHLRRHLQRHRRLLIAAANSGTSW